MGRYDLNHNPQGSQPVPPGALGYAGLALVMMSSGSVFLFTAFALEGYRPEEVAAGKIFIGGLFLLLPVIGGLFRHLRLEHGRWLFLLGAVGYAFPNVTLAWALKYIDTSVAAFFMAGMPLFSLLMIRLILKERFRPRKWLGFAVGLVGLLIMINHANPDTGTQVGLLPFFALLFTCFGFVTSPIIIQKMPPLPPLLVTALGLLAGSLCLLPFGLIGFIETSGRLVGRWDATALTALTGIAVLGVALSGVGQAVRTWVIQRHGSTFFSVIGYLVPIWAALLGIVFLGETLTLQNTLAFVVICSGLALAQFDDLSRAQSFLRRIFFPAQF